MYLRPGACSIHFKKEKGDPLTDDNKRGGAVEIFLHKIGALNALAAIDNQPSKKSDSIVLVPNLQLSMIKDSLRANIQAREKRRNKNSVSSIFIRAPA